MEIIKNKQKIVAIIQARTGSTRLPGKVLLNLQGKTVLEHVIERVKACKNIHQVIVATTINKEDLEIVNICCKTNTSVYCGSEEDVLDRYYQAARLFRADHIIRITADCPLIDPKVVSKIIKFHISRKSDYTSNCLKVTFPDGEDTEIVTFSTLYTAWKKARLSSEREHVTSYIEKNPKLFKQVNFENTTDLSNMRWTLDEPDDYKFIKKIFKHLYTPNKIFGMRDVLLFLKKHPNLEKINTHIIRNEGYIKSLKHDKIVNIG